jgi:hypothetical protein
MLKEIEEDEEAEKARGKSRLSQTDIQRIVAEQLKKLRDES